MIRDGNLAISEMKRLNDSIKDAKISADIDRLEDLSAKIFAQVKADPKSCRRSANLWTTICPPRSSS